MNKQECSARGLPLNNHTVLFADLLRNIGAKVGFGLTYLFSIPLLMLFPPKLFYSIQTQLSQLQG